MVRSKVIERRDELSFRQISRSAKDHNGARVDRLNWREDASEKAQRESFGIMVNYRYVVTDLDENLVRARAGAPRSRRAIAQLL